MGGRGIQELGIWRLEEEEAMVEEELVDDGDGATLEAALLPSSG
jgi:hypothetical protein